MRKTIRVDEDTHAALAALKGDDETFDVEGLRDLLTVDFLPTGAD